MKLTPTPNWTHSMLQPEHAIHHQQHFTSPWNYLICGFQGFIRQTKFPSVDSFSAPTHLSLCCRGGHCAARQVDQNRSSLNIEPWLITSRVYFFFYTWTTSAGPDFSDSTNRGRCVGSLFSHIKIYVVTWNSILTLKVTHYKEVVSHTGQ